MGDGCICAAAAHATSGVTEAIRVVADSVTQCKFEATYPASDDCVLYKILDVLVGRPAERQSSTTRAHAES